MTDQSLVPYPPDSQRTETVNSEAEPIPSRVPERIGRYHIKRVIASGGMGTVYEATQDNPRRVVAVKVMKQGISSKSALRRFEYEGQILGRLRHPGIAQIYEAGTYDPDQSRERKPADIRSPHAAQPDEPVTGLAPGALTASVPYFAMEYIPNAKLITKYADEKKLGTRQRMELFAKVCDAVHHGHQKGIIHRDLKPGNILVDSHGEVKVIDFGVARGTDSDLAVTMQQTDIGQLIGTLQYMSPEQCEGDPHDIDTRSDVYALGVVLYELLSGKLPYDVSRSKIFDGTRMIREQQPTKLGTMDTALRGDVETIVFKALEKGRDRRYQSAVEFGQDIRRFLSGEAITARPPSIIYQLRVFARRNKGLFTAIAAVFIVLVAGIIVSTTLYLRAEGSERTAQAEAAQARAQRDNAQLIGDFMNQMLGGVEPGVALGRDTTLLREIMDTAAKRINGGELARAPEAELRLRWTIGNVYQAVSAYDSAEEMLRPAVELARRIHEQEHPDVATSLHALGLLFCAKGDYTGAESLHLQALDMRRKLLGQEHLDVAESLTAVGRIRDFSGYFPEAEKLDREALRIQRKLLGDEHRDIWSSLTYLGEVLVKLGRHSEAEEVHRSALAMARKLFGPVHPIIAESLRDVGLAAARKGDYPQAEQLLGDALTMQRALMGNNHNAVAYSLWKLGDLRSQQGFYRDAERLLRESVGLSRRLLGDKHASTSLWLLELGKALRHQGKHEEAEPVLREARQIQLEYSAHQTHKNVELADINQWLAHVLNDTGGHEEAEKLVNEALAIKRDALGDDHLDVAGLLCTLASIRERNGDRSSAEQLVRQAVEMSRRLDEFGMVTGAYLHQLGALLYRQDKLPEAEAVLRESLQLRRSVLGGDHPAVAECSVALAKLAARQGRFQEGEELAGDALRIYQARPDGAAWLHADAQSTLGAALTGQGRFTEAETLLVEAFDALRDQSIAPPWIKEDALLALTALYDQWDAAEPGKGYAEKAAQWRKKLEETPKCRHSQLRFPSTQPQRTGTEFEVANLFMIRSFGPQFAASANSAPLLRGAVLRTGAK